MRGAGIGRLLLDELLRMGLAAGVREVVAVFGRSDSGVDFGASGGGAVQLQTSTDSGTTWVDYGSSARLNSSGSMLVRTAIVDDGVTSGSGARS
ncbi:MAG: hypothetical protein RL354_689, partial [Planctomycetota bacterium]